MVAGTDCLSLPHTGLQAGSCYPIAAGTASGHPEHPGVVDIEVGNALQVAVEIDGIAAIVVSASPSLSGRIEPGNDDIDRQRRSVDASEPGRGLCVIAFACRQHSVCAAQAVR